MDKTQITLEIGTTFLYEGHEYTLCVAQMSRGFEGRSLQLQCLEPLYAARDTQEKVMRRETLEKSAALLPKLEAELNG